MSQVPPSSGLVQWLRRQAEPVAGIAAVNLWLPSLLYAVAVYFPLASAMVLEPARRAAVTPPPGAFALTRLVWRPEPLELPVYIAGFVVIPLLAAGGFAVLRPLVARREIIGTLVRHWPLSVAAGLAAVISFKLGLHRFAFDAWRHFEPRGEAKQQLLLLAALAVGGVAYLRRFDLAAGWRRLGAVHWWRWRWVFFAGLALLMFDPSLKYDHYHYQYFLGIINDLRHGKWLLVDTAGYYGLANILALHGWFLLAGVLSYTALNLVLQAVAIASAVSWTYLLRRLTGSTLLAYVAVVALVLYQYLPVLPLDRIYQTPSTGALRHVVFLLAAWAWLWWQESGQRRAAALAALALAAVGFFWFPDSGLYLAIATLATVGFLTGRPRRRIGPWLARVGAAAGVLAVGIGLLAAGYSLLTLRMVGRWSDWGQYFSPLVTFGRGYQLFALPWFGFYQVYVAVFLATLLALAWRRWVTGRPLSGDAVAFFIASYGALQLSYYISRSYSPNLASRHAFLFVLLGAWWYAQFLRAPRAVDPTLARGASALAVTLLVFGVALAPFKLRATLAERNYAGLPASFTAETIGRPEVFGGDAAVLDDIAVLKRDYADILRPALLHWWDVKILMEWNKTNALPLYEFSAPLTQAELDPAIAYVRQAKPQRLFVGRTDTTGFQQGFSIYQDKIDYFWKAVQDGYALERQLQTMTIYRSTSPPPYEERGGERSSDPGTPTTADPLLISPPEDVLPRRIRLGRRSARGGEFFNQF